VASTGSASSTASSSPIKPGTPGGSCWVGVRGSSGGGEPALVRALPCQARYPTAASARKIASHVAVATWTRRRRVRDRLRVHSVRAGSSSAAGARLGGRGAVVFCETGVAWRAALALSISSVASGSLGKSKVGPWRPGAALPKFPSSGSPVGATSGIIVGEDPRRSESRKMGGAGVDVRADFSDRRRGPAERGVCGVGTGASGSPSGGGSRFGGGSLVTACPSTTVGACVSSVDGSGGSSTWVYKG
jgi:hypothetical protein